MADYDLIPYYEDEELFQDNYSKPNDTNVTDLHAYYMSQFNLELENGSKNKSKYDNFKNGIEESFDFEVLDSWDTNTNNQTDFEVLGNNVESNINEQNIKEVLLDLDSIDFECKSSNTEQTAKSNDSISNFYDSNEYIDDESLIDELCREETEPYSLTPEKYEEEPFVAMSNEKHLLPSIETAFSKRYCYNTQDNIQENNTNQTNIENTIQPLNSVDQYSYPNNLLYNLNNDNNYILPDTPTSCAEFNFENCERKHSISESLDSDIQSNYQDDNSDGYDEDELFINLDEFGLNLENDDINTEENKTQRKVENEKAHGERVCMWEHCFEKYPNQNTLVEHIERAHVNTYKGDEFSCLWRECARARRPFNARYKLLIHMRVHSGHKPNRCHHAGCGKAFSRLENLKIHVRSHTGERPYACPAPHCRKAFSNSSDRAKHQRTHFNARPYACGALGCNKRYTDPSSLRKHVKTHPHLPPAPRAALPPNRPIRRQEHTVPSSPAKLTTLRCIRDKLTVPKMQKF